MIDRGWLVSALGDHHVDDWVLTERKQQIAIVDADGDLRRREARTRWTIVVYRDLPSGRGSARFELEAISGRARELIDQAVAIAGASVAPPWHSARLAAPAKVALADPALAKAPLLDAADQLVRAARPPAGATALARARVVQEQVEIQSRAGLRESWAASAVTVGAIVANGEHSLEIARAGRRVDELARDTEAAVRAAASDLAAIASARPPTAGSGPIVLASEALWHGGGYGLWAALAHQADALRERQGLARFRLGMPIADGAAAIAEPLTVTSDGAIDFAFASAPIGDDGDAVRAFALVDRGVAAELALSPHEAALRQRDPNGGLRNLVVAPGTWDATRPLAAPKSLEIRRLRTATIDAYTGDASLEIALAVERTDGNPDRFVRGGTIRLDLIAALALARRSAEVIHRGALVGPAAVWLERAELLA